MKAKIRFISPCWKGCFKPKTINHPSLSLSLSLSFQGPEAYGNKLLCCLVVLSLSCTCTRSQLQLPDTASRFSVRGGGGVKVVLFCCLRRYGHACFSSRQSDGGRGSSEKEWVGFDFKNVAFTSVTGWHEWKLGRVKWPVSVQDNGGNDCWTRSARKDWAFWTK